MMQRTVKWKLAARKLGRPCAPGIEGNVITDERIPGGLLPPRFSLVV